MFCARTEREMDRLKARNRELLAALKTAIRVADEAHDEWDRAPSGMRAGKILLALAGHLPRYRKEIDQIHAVLKQEAALREGQR